MDYYQKNPSETDALRGTIYEDKIMELIKSKAKVNKKEITKNEAEKILKSAHDQEHMHDHDHSKDKKTTSYKKKSQTSGQKTKQSKKS
jgi:trigger factor